MELKDWEKELTLKCDSIISEYKDLAFIIKLMDSFEDENIINVAEYFMTIQLLRLQKRQEEEIKWPF